MSEKRAFCATEIRKVARQEDDPRGDGRKSLRGAGAAKTWRDVAPSCSGTSCAGRFLEVHFIRDERSLYWIHRMSICILKDIISIHPLMTVFEILRNPKADGVHRRTTCRYCRMARTWR